MKLKQLIMQGFKSFADKTTIDFTDGVTAIVGPNGSGKSNVIEAIRWAMGETSAKSLRGTRMADVVFSGTARRQAVNFSEVTLILDNSDRFLDIDQDEVMIGRRLSRSGQSDYTLNKEIVRMKDITNLFIDTGLGKESFSIISQGQVEAIFNSKPEERRKIFEEAAGVLKYKERKEVAEKKLEETKDNLDRVKDVLYEVEHQLEGLSRERDRAKNYLVKTEELTDLDIHVTTIDITEADKEARKHSTLLKEVTARCEQAQILLQQYARDLESKKNQRVSIEEKIEMLHEQVVSIVQEVERSESAVQLFAEKGRHSEQERKRLENEYVELEKDLAELSEKTQAATVNKEAFQAKLTTTQAELDEIKTKLHALSLDKETVMRELRSRYMTLMQESSRLNNEESHLERQKQQLEAALNRAQEERKNFKVQVANDADTQTSAADLVVVQKDLEELLENHQKAHQKLQKLRKEWEDLSEKRQELQQKEAILKSRKQSLEEMEANYTGYFQGVRHVMKNKNHLTGIVGTVAELIQVPDPISEAIDIALGSQSQFVIVEDDSAGRQAIQYLREANAGRATFLPLSTMKSRYVSQHLQQQAQKVNGYVGVASDLIQFDPRYKPVIENLLGHLFIAENLEAANALSRAMNQRNRIVSLEGDVINVGGSMTGGARQKSQNAHLFSQANDLKKMMELLPQYSNKIAQLLEQENALQIESKELSEILTTLQEKGEAKRFEEHELKLEVERQNEQNAQYERQKQALEFTVKDHEEDLAEVIATLANIQTQKITNEKESQETQKEMDELEEIFSRREVESERLQLEQEKWQEQISEQKIEMAQIEKELQFYQAQVKTTEEKLAEITATFEKRAQLQNEDDYEEMTSELEKYIAEREHLEKSLDAERAARDELTRAINSVEIEESRIRLHVENDKEEMNRLQLIIQKLEDKLSHLLHLLAEEYQVSYEATKHLSDQEIDLPQARERIRQLKGEIKALGPVNIQAIEEYDVLEERYNFMTTQRDDLLEAQDDLFETMSALDERVEDLFKETFDAIQKQFAIVFPKMFGGGRAELVLTDPSDLLTTGVDIKAQPPGKNLQQLSLLSGGERALTAISLLFAIIHTRPIPFVILDEVEAALDDANVIRFSHYLDTFEEDEIQFIVITHRKGTMEAADQLYGVVMQEKGVSSVVSVRLSEVDEYVEEP